MKHIWFLLYVLLILGSCGNDDGLFLIGDPPNNDIFPNSLEKMCFDFFDLGHEKLSVYEAAKEIDSGDQFVQALKGTLERDPGLMMSLNGEKEGAFTLLIPSNSEWEQFLSSQPVSKLTEDKIDVLVREHILDESLHYKTVTAGLPLTQNLNVRIIWLGKNENGCPNLNQEADFLVVEDTCANGLIHLLNGVLVPDPDLY